MNSLYEFIHLNGRLYPDKPAVIYGDERYSYSRLNAEADALAGGLSSLGVRRGTVAALMMHNGVTFIECLLALWKLGASAAPLHFRSTPAEMAELISVSGAGYVIFGESMRAAAMRTAEKLPAGGPVFISELPGGAEASLKELSAGGHAAAEGVPTGEDDELLRVFTGGTTGTQKAAIHTNGSFLMYMLSCYLLGGLYCRDDVFLNYAPLCHIGGLRVAMGTLMTGGTLVLMPRFDPGEFASLIEKERVTQLFLIPPPIILRLDGGAAARTPDLGSVRRVRLSGSANSRQVTEHIFRLFPNADILYGYGSTEGAASLMNIYSRADYGRDPGVADPVGLPVPLEELRLVAPDGSEAGDGTVGELYGRSLYMLRSYTSGEGPGPDGYFATGDLMYRMADGRYMFVGRKKDMIKSGGENVYAAETEQVIKQFPGVADCAVVGLPHPEYGEAVVAAVTMLDGYEASEEAVIDFCRARMSGFKKPRRVLFMELPRTTAGKVRKDRLRQELMDTLGDDLFHNREEKRQ